jgi:hypothetical protein
MKTTSAAAMELLLNLTPLNLLIMAEARMALYRLHILKQPAVPNTLAGLLSFWKNVRTHFGYAVRSHYSNIQLL